MAKKTNKKMESASMPMHASGHASAAKSCGAWGLTLLRVVVGAFLMFHGIVKFMGLGGVSSFFATLGVPGWFAPLVAAVEVLGGLALILGVWTMWAGMLLALDMVGAVGFAWLHWGWFAWIVEIVALLAMIAMATSWKRVGEWALGIVFAVLVLAVLAMAVTHGFKITGETETLYLAAAFALGVNGPGACAIQKRA